jgi:hypothetical protein
MNEPAVIVNKSGFFSSIVKGIFGTIMVVIICATALGLYAVYALDHNIGRITSIVNSGEPSWQVLLPPVLGEALNDRRALDYRRSLDIEARVERGSVGEGRGVLVIEVHNRGSQVVSWLGLRAVVEDESPEKYLSLNIMAATPAMMGDWRGPLGPGESTIVTRAIHDVQGTPKVRIEVADLRTWVARPETPPPLPGVPVPPAVTNDVPSLPPTSDAMETRAPRHSGERHEATPAPEAEHQTL